MNAFLDRALPAWCIENKKWRYQSQDWAHWLKAAIALYRRALSISPADDTLHRCMAHALVKRDRHLEALAFFTEAIKFNPTFARTRCRSGRW